MSEKSGAVLPSLTLCAKIGDAAAIAIADAIKKDFKCFMYEKITNMERKSKFKISFGPGIYIIFILIEKTHPYYLHSFIFCSHNSLYSFVL